MGQALEELGREGVYQRDAEDGSGQDLNQGRSHGVLRLGDIKKPYHRPGCCRTIGATFKRISRAASTVSKLSQRNLCRLLFPDGERFDQLPHMLFETLEGLGWQVLQCSLEDADSGFRCQR